jgi:hypothetical protein
MIPCCLSVSARPITSSDDLPEIMKKLNSVLAVHTHDAMLVKNWLFRSLLTTVQGLLWLQEKIF